MTIVSSLSRAVFLLIISSPIMLIILSFSHQQTVLQNPLLTESQIRNAQQLLINNDPRLLIGTNDQAINLSETELNSLLHYFKNESPSLEDISVYTDIKTDHLTVNTSIYVPDFPFGEFVNITIEAKSLDSSLSIESIQIGALKVPYSLLKPFFKSMQSTLSNESNYQLIYTLLNSIENISLLEDKLSITLNWQVANLASIQNQARQLIISPEERELIIYFQQQLITILNTTPFPNSTLELNALTKPMFLAATQSPPLNADPIVENRAIFIVLTAYLTDLELEDFIGPIEGYELEVPKQLRVQIESRVDLAQHVISSATIASASSVSMANIVSVYKEVHDSRYRTGFSFSDITANQVGTLLGKLSSQDSNSALQLQSLLSMTSSNTEFMPLVGTYDGLTEEEFIALYQNRESEKYLQRIDEINQKISQRPFFQKFSSTTIKDTQ